MIKHLILFSLLGCVLSTTWRKNYDYIIVGGGTAGCVLARRLSENPNVSVLVLEAGPNIFHDSIVSTPRIWPNVVLDPKYGFGYVTEPDPGLNNRRIPVFAGKLLGGSGSHNVMAVTRGSRHDFDHWEKLGNKGWSYDDVLPYFKKAEQVLSPELATSEFRGTNGPWETNWVYANPIQDKLLQAGEELGFKITGDINGAEMENVGRAQTSVNKDGKRSSTADSYLRPVLGRLNLDLVTEAFVRKIRIENLKATGVVFETEQDGKTFFVRATKEVILSAGTVNSPKILMLSGIGPRDHLESLGIKAIADIPVGNSLHEHAILNFHRYSTNLTTPKLFAPETLFQYVFQGKGLWSSSGSQVMGFFKSKTQPVNSKSPHIEINFSVSAPLLSQELLNFIQNGTQIPKYLLDEFANSESEYIVLNANSILLHPRSTGTYRLRSKNPHDSPKININFMKNEKDMADMIEAIRLVQQFAETKTMKDIDANDVTRIIEGCITDGFNTDQYWRCVIRNVVRGIAHWSSSCSMGPNGTVSSTLRVKGVKNLRVVDASVMPDIISGHTAAATIMIAEKASDFIKRSNKTFK